MKTFIFYLLIFISPNLLFCQETFYKTFSLTGFAYGATVIQTLDRKFLVYGLSAYTNYDSLYFLLKTEPNGDSIWLHRYVGSDYTTFFHAINKTLIATADSGYLFLSNGNYGSIDTTFLIKTDKNGNTSQTVRFTGLTNATLQPTTDGGYVLCGFDSVRRIALIKTTLSGQEIWRKWISGIYTIYPTYHGPDEISIQQTLDEGFIISRNNYYYFNGLIAIDAILTKTSNTGDTLWSKSFHYFPYQKFSNILISSGNRFIAGGTVDSLSFYEPTHLNGYVMNFDENGDTLWTKTYVRPGNQDLFTLRKTNDGGYIACGDNNPNTPWPYTGYYGFYLMRMNANGDTLWTKTYPGGNGNLTGLSVQQTSDNGFIACGIQWDSSEYHSSVYLIKTDGLGNVYPQGINDKHPSFSLSLFPNPTRGMVYLNPPGKYNILEISDLLGKVIIRKDIDPDNNSTLMIDLSGNPGGIYIIRLRNDQGIATGKIVLEE